MVTVLCLMWLELYLCPSHGSIPFRFQLFLFFKAMLSCASGINTFSRHICMVEYGLLQKAIQVILDTEGIWKRWSETKRKDLILFSQRGKSFAAGIGLTNSWLTVSSSQLPCEVFQQGWMPAINFNPISVSSNLKPGFLNDQSELYTPCTREDLVAWVILPSVDIWSKCKIWKVFVSQ
jgi:hypothetical protein